MFAWSETAAVRPISGALFVYAMTEDGHHEYFAARQIQVQFAVGQDGRNLRSGFERFGLSAEALYLLGVVGLVGVSLASASH
jgi:hypothetical protein